MFCVCRRALKEQGASHPASAGVIQMSQVLPFRFKILTHSGMQARRHRRTGLTPLLAGLAVSAKNHMPGMTTAMAVLASAHRDCGLLGLGGDKTEYS